MDEKKEKEVSYVWAACCASCKHLAPTVWGEGVDSSYCLKHEEIIWIAGICDNYDPADQGASYKLNSDAQ